MAGGAGIAGSGASDPFVEMMRLLTDPVKLQAEYERLNKAKAEAQEVIDLAGPASEITAIYASLTTLKSNAQADYERLRTNAEGYVAEAQAKAEQIVAAGIDKAALIRANAQAVLDEAGAKLIEADRARAEVAQWQDNLQRREQALAARASELDAQSEALAVRESALVSKAQALADTQAHLATTIATLAE